MATTKQIGLAARDADLRDRFISKAAELGIPSPEYWVDSHMRALVAIDLDGPDGASDSVASVYDYAVQTRPEVPPRPGENLAAVTDVHLQAAIEQIEQRDAANSGEAGGA